MIYICDGTNTHLRIEIIKYVYRSTFINLKYTDKNVFIPACATAPYLLTTHSQLLKYTGQPPPTPSKWKALDFT